MPAWAVEREAELRLGGGALGEVEGGDGPLATVDKKFHRQFLHIVPAAIAHGDLHGHAATHEIGRSIEDERVDVEVVGGDSIERDKGMVKERMLNVECRMPAIEERGLEIADNIAMAVGSAAGRHEIALPLDDLAQIVAGRGNLQGIDGIEEFLAAEPTELLATHVVGQKLVAVVGMMRGDDFTRFLLGSLELGAVGAAVFHAEGIVDEDAHHRGAGVQRLPLAGEHGTRKRQHKECHRQKARQEHQPLPHGAAATALVTQLAQAVDIAEIDLTVAAEIEQVHHHRQSQRQKAPEKERLAENHSQPPFLA